MMGFKKAIAIVIFTTIVAGLAEYINILAHPNLQPLLTIFIITMTTLTNGLSVWYYCHKKS